MSLKVYYDLMSQPSRAIIILLKVAKIPYTDCPVALRKGAHLTPEFGQITPFKKVPAIEHNGFKLAESVAIMRYFSREFPMEDHWYPKESKAQALVDQYLEWQHLNVRLGGAMYFMTKVLYPAISGEPVNEKRLKNYADKLEESITTLETIFLKDRPFVAGEKISMADILCACELEQPLAIGYDIFKGHARLEEYMKRVREQLQPHYDEAHIHLKKLGDARRPKGKL